LRLNMYMLAAIVNQKDPSAPTTSLSIDMMLTFCQFLSLCFTAI